MPKTKISEFDIDPANNTDINSINIAEGCAPSGINNAIRQLMSDLKDLQAGTSGDTIPIAAGGTGSTTASAARTALGLAIGTNVQAYSANLAGWSGVATSAKQDTLVSGTNIKTVNGTSLLGSGDITSGDVTTSGTQTLTNKTISADDNTISGIAASSFVVSNGSGNIDGSASQKAIPSGVVVGTTDTQTLTNKTINASQLVDASITPAKLSGAQSGSAPIYGARAWVNFNGTGTVAIRASGNVSSITDNGTGDYTVNFTTAMSDANYSVTETCSGQSIVNSTSLSTSNCTAITYTPNLGQVDPSIVNVAIFR